MLLVSTVASAQLNPGQFVSLRKPPTVTAATGCASGSISNLTHCWPLTSATISGTTVTDTVAGLNGTASAAGMGTATNHSGTANSATAFNGSVYITLASSPVAHQSAHSIFFWVKVTDVTAGGSGGASQRYLYFGVDATHDTQFANNEPTGQVDVRLDVASNKGVAMTSDALVSGTWACIGYTFDGSATAIMYLNGAAISAPGAELGFGVSNPNYTIGGRSSSAGLMTGSLAMVGTFDKALTSGEASTYCSGT